MDGTTLAILIVLAAVAVSAFIIYRRKKNEYQPPKAKAPQKSGKLRDIPVRRATPRINVTGPTPVPLDPVPNGGPALVRKVSVSRSRVYIIPDKPFRPKGDSTAENQFNVEQGLATGDTMRIVAELRDDAGNPVSAPVRGIIDLFTGNALETDPKYRVADPDGSAVFFYTMRESDQVPGGSKLITAAVLDGDRVVTLSPTALHDTRTETDPNDPFFRGK